MDDTLNFAVSHFIMHARRCCGDSTGPYLSAMFPIERHRFQSYGQRTGECLGARKVDEDLVEFSICELLGYLFL
jgi:hypothetical protein